MLASALILSIIAVLGWAAVDRIRGKGATLGE